MKRKWIAAASSLVLGCSAIAMPFSGAVTVQAADSRSGFVTTNGTQFMLDGSTFYYAGTNNYYINFKPKATVDAALEDAAAMGMKVVRTWGNLDAGVKTDKVSDKGYTVFTDSVDGSGEKEGVYYQYFDADLNKPVVNEGEDGLQKLDYALYKAEQEGVKLLITFTNNWEAFGGMGQYVKWAQLAGENVTGHDDFYTNETIKGWYKNYVKTLLNHENVYTGVKYKDDPTVFSWELANEPRCESDAGCEKNVVVNWAKEMSVYVKSIDSNHMLAVGDEGFYNYGYNDFPEGDHKYVYHGSSGMDFLQLTALPDIDFGTLHVYCDQWGLTKEQGEFWFKKHGEDTAAMNKPLIAEEFGWKDQSERADVYKDWFDIFEGKTYEGVEFAGTNYWMLASMDGDSLYQDYDGYTVYYRDYPKTNDARDVIMAHAERMSARNAQNSISPKKADFDVVNPKDVTFQATMKLGEISGVQLGDTVLKNGTDYTVSSSSVTIAADVLKKLELGNHKVTVLTTEGAQPTALIRVYDSTAEEQSRSVIDDFESYADSKAVSAAYTPNSNGDTLTLTLDKENVKNGKAALKYAYSVADGGPGYCGATKKLGGADWTGFDGIRFWILSDGSNRETTFQFVDGAGAYWESIQKVTANEGWTEVKIPFSDFHVQQWGTAAETPTLSGVQEFSIYTGQNGNPGTGVWYFDDIGLYHDGTVTVPDAEATETTAVYDKQDPTDIIFTIITNGHALTGITEDGNALQQGTDFAVNGSQFRFNRSYLDTLAAGEHTLHVSFADCPDVVLTITVKDGSVTTETTETTVTTTSETTTTETETSTSTEDTGKTSETVSSDTTETTASATTSETVTSASATETSSQTTATSEETPGSVLYGDINLDGKVDIADAVLLNKATAGVVELNESARTNADCDADGTVGGNDALALLRFLVHIINSLPESK